MIYKIITPLLFLCLPFFANAQYAHVRQSADDLYKEGVKLFQSQQYNSAQKLLEEYANHPHSNDLQSQNAEYLSALSAIYLFHADGEARIKNFVNTYPANSYADEAYFELGNFYFREKNYPKAIQYYEETDEDVLGQKDKEDYQFKLAYSYFSRKAFSEALPYFNKLKRSSSSYQSAASYYAGYIAFEQGDYNQALIDLKKAGENDSYSSTTATMIANIYYRQKKYDQVIEYAQNISNNVSGMASADLSLIIGDSYYFKNNYSKASEYFTDFRDKSKAKPEREVLYRMAYAEYKQENTGEATQLFEQVGLGKDSLSQYSTYYLGKLYLENDNPRYAVNAFQQAKLLDYIPAIKEESQYQLAKLYIKQKLFSDAISELKDFVSRYPQSNYATEANELLSQAYLNTNAYELAIEFIESIPNKTLRLKEAYQKVAFYQGAEYFNQAQFYKAVQFFEKSVSYPQNKSLAGKAYYWMGEAYATGKKYEEAINAYEKALNHSSSSDEWYPALQYGLAHVYYNDKQFSNALNYFNAYVKYGKSRPYYEDALIRLADCYYVSKKYSLALSNYQTAIDQKNEKSDYAYFQKGVIHSILSENEKANRHFDVVISTYKKSNYYDNALFQKALMAFESGKYSEAIDGFSYLLKATNQTPLRPYALSKRAIAYFNLRKYKEAEEDYKMILDNYLTHQTANGALLGLQEIYSMQGLSGDLDKYLAEYKKANPNDKEITSIEFDAAKSIYFNQNYNKAIAAFQNYLNEYPDNALSYEAKYYLADSYYRSQQYDKALPYFYEVVQEDKTPFVKRSVQKIAELELERSNYENAELYYNKVLELADNDKDKYIAWSGLLQIAKAQSLYSEMIQYADLILDKAAVNPNVMNEAYLNKGLAYYYQGDYKNAESHFKSAVNNAKDANAAEAKYLIALMQYNKDEHQNSINTLFELNNDFANYSEWLGKSFLLIADNYYEMNELFQAKATLNSIIENAQSVVLKKEAQLKLAKIEEEDQRKAEVIKNEEDSIRALQGEMILDTDSTKN
ncbi:tetratricopeptide repeat protein [Marivirga sp. S37H4]|uniref:Tetratricopeptide repeat protein n=1 Tax=Marivirga aurantiaca TaxID=2802615 RepID=A0A934WWH2_9BACT|nr:tetratricopeptide repeat protein [Marivirga aurantiaca]MBK6264227.1 tetratricopeptide repeat protein [Marivirga aurantiaca]